MKKFFVGLLSIFLIIGASLLVACGTKKVSLSLSTDNVAIKLYSGNEEGDIQTVTATVSGAGNNNTIKVVNNYESIIGYSTKPSTSGKTIITIIGKSEGYAELIVITEQGNVSKTISVEVYSEVSSMEQKVEEQLPKQNFAVRGDTIDLIEENLLVFYPSNLSKKTITWSFKDIITNASIENNKLTINDDYLDDTITLVATTENGVTTEVVLPVLEKINDTLSISYSYDKASDFTAIKGITNLSIVPNFAEDPNYQLYVKVNYLGNLSVKSIVTDKNGLDASEKVIITKDGTDTDGYPIYKIVINNQYQNINENFTIIFNIGYTDYDYNVSTIENAINLIARERVSNIEIKNDDNEFIINGQNEVYYSSYLNQYGEAYSVELLPSTVQSSNNGYYITVEYVSIAPGLIEDGICPLEFYYKDSVNGAIYPIRFVEENGIFKSYSAINYRNIYIKASEQIKLSAENIVSITFKSQENEKVTKTIIASLIKSATLEEFNAVFENADFSVNSSVRDNGGAINLEKIFTLQGQSSINGMLSLVNESEHVDLTLSEISSTSDSVTFKVLLTLKESSYGVTSLDKYYFVHANGFVSNEFNIDIFLPLTTANINYNNVSDSVTSYTQSKKYYDLDGNIFEGDISYNSISSLMIKNGTTTPILYSFNKSNNYSAEANITIRYFDFDENSFTLEEFKALVNDSAGLSQIINASSEISNIANFSADKNNIITKNVGNTYAVIFFTGKGDGENVDENGNITIIRIIQIESYINPAGFSIENNNVNLYAQNSVSTRDKDLTTYRATINFNNINITYRDLSNFKFVSTKKDSEGNLVMGQSSIIGNTIKWENGRYLIENISINNSSISFDIVGLNTFGEGAFYDDLEIHYVIQVQTNEGLQDIDCFWSTLKISVKNAQRIESVEWDNFDEDGIYFEVGSSEIQYLTFKTSPTNARNNHLIYVVTDDTDNSTTTFIDVDSEIRDDAVALQLNHNISKGMNGYLYVLPEDSAYQNTITFFYLENGIEKEGTVAIEQLSAVSSINEELSWYEFLVNNAYFKNITTLDSDYEEILFADILLRIEINVADGRDFEHAYRIYDENEFNNIKSDLYYTVMQSINISSSRSSLNQFTGGLQGYTEDVTLVLNGSNFAQNLSGTIRNITFAGNVTGNGFVVDTINETGVIENVTIETNGLYPSVLNYTESNSMVGGIAGINYGIIDKASVLGLNISASSSYVGGIAGENFNVVKNSNVEFYNLKSITNDGTTFTSKFNGNIVGGIVGRANANENKTGLIENSFVYNYTLDSSSLTGNMVGAIIGELAANTKIFKSFAVGSVSLAIANNPTSITLNAESDYYIGIKSSEDSYSVTYYHGDYLTSGGENEGTSPNLVKSGSEGFLSYVNNGKPHYKDVYQTQSISSVSNYSVSTVKDSNGYYKSLEVNSNAGILFYYNVNALNLSESEITDLNKINTISLAQLVGQENISQNIILTSSNEKIAQVIGNSILIKSTGSVDLTLSAKQDVNINKTINIQVLYAMSDMIVSWIDNAGNQNIVQNNSVSYLQKTKTRNFDFDYEKTYVTLGASANKYTFTNNSMTIDYEIDFANSEDNIIDNKLVTFVKNDNSYQAVADFNAVDTKVKFYTLLDQYSSDKQNVYQNAIYKTFYKEFTLSPSDGVISFDISEEGVPITPSTNSTISVKVETTAETDKTGLTPKIKYNGEELKLLSSEEIENSNGENVTYNYALHGESVSILSVNVVLKDENVQTGEIIRYTYKFDVTFSVHSDYQSKVSEDMLFDVSFVSKSGSDSEYQTTGSSSFKLSLTKQQFTNIDITNYNIKEPQWVNIDGNFYVQHTKDTLVGVVAPGSSTILQITVNPQFAYYDYMELSYSNASVSNAINFTLLKELENGKFIEVNDSEISYVGDKVVYRPTAEEKKSGKLFFKVWVNTTVDSDNTITLNASFFSGNGGNPLSSVTSYLSVSYLSEPTVTIDGLDSAYVALGSTVDVEIQVKHDQTLDSLSIASDDTLKGVQLGEIGKPKPDETRGIKIYRTSLTLQVNAVAKDSTIYVQALVSRELNGSEEQKITYATARIVDFKVDTNNVEISDADSNNIINVWLNVPKSFNIKYNCLPTSYNYDQSDSESVAKVQYLLNARQDFIDTQLYYNGSYSGGQTPNTTKTDYAINYLPNENGDLVPQQLKKRIVYITDSGESPIGDANSNEPLSFSFSDDGMVSVSGNRMTSGVRLAVKTYIYAGGYITTEYTYFTVNVTTYSDLDIPLPIYSATDFKNLNPSNYQTSDNVSEEDYILMNDIVLENFSPFNTSLIRSLDGNGYTIFIKSFDSTISGSTKNFALFNEVTKNTTLKNVRVNIYNGGQIDVDVSKFNGNGTINIAGFAITNNGVITNCEVVSYYTDDYAIGNIENVNVKACELHGNSEGINLTLRNGANTSPITISTTSKWSSNVAGFVLNNNASITNSRVGGDSVIVAKDVVTTNVNGQEIPSGYVSAEEIQLGTFYINAQGNISGFVNYNYGNISSCFVKNIDVQNQSAGFVTNGFANINGENAKISGSYIEGEETPNAKDEDAYSREGSSLKSKTGVISGFINSNEGNIIDCYSNILIANEEDTTEVYLASGFVYQNSNYIENCFTACQIQSSKFNQINFSGVDANGELLAKGQYVNCYFYDKNYYEQDTTSDNTTESLYGTGVTLITLPNDSSKYYGFAISNGSTDGIWRIDDEKGITLIEANNISYSNRYMLEVDEDYEGATGSYNGKTYILLYSVLRINSGREIDTKLGGENNPILINDATNFAEVLGNSSSTNIQQYYSEYYIWGSYRLTNDIDLTSIVSDSSKILPSTQRAFSGKIYGNRFTISGISITSDNMNTSYGLFASIQPRLSSVPIITNLNLDISQVDAGNTVFVGGLAGYIIDSFIINVDINISQEGGIYGSNFVGGLAGFVFGNSKLINLEVNNPTVYAYKYNSLGIDDYFTTSKIYSLRTDIANNLTATTPISSSIINSLLKYSYAGSVAGYVDNFSSQANSFNINQSTNYTADNIRVLGVVNVRGEVAGGVFGLTGYQTNLNDVGIEITAPMENNQSHIIAMKYFAGGIVGQSFGKLNRVYSQYDETTQYNIESNISKYYQGNYDVERGATDIFYTDNNYSQIYVGGIAGYVESGIIEISYSKLNVIGLKANYVGGIIGGMELENQHTYKYSNSKIPEQSIYSAYVMNEVYSTGDIRAKDEENKITANAGGIVGTIKGRSKNVTFLSVNPLNYISFYDYTNGINYANLTAVSYQEKSISNLLGVNLLVGSVFKNISNNENIVWEEEIINNSNYVNNYFNIQTAKEGAEGTDASSSVSSQRASIGVYESYYYNNFKVYVNLFSGVEANIGANPENNLFYAIVTPMQYQNITVGRSYTQQAFISSGIWFSSNWNHGTEDLFPTIKYQSTSSLIYLDAYKESIENVLESINRNPNLTVVVRGKESKESNTFIDIDLRDFEQQFLVGGKFAGTLVRYNDVKIITDKQFIGEDGVAPGFSAINLEIAFAPNITDSSSNKFVINSGSGLFSAMALNEVTITDLQLDLSSQVSVELQDSSLDFGLVAGTIQSSSIDGVTIQAGFEINDGSNVSNGYTFSASEPILSINNENTISNSNIGLIAGIIEQNSLTNIMKIDNISVTTGFGNDLIIVTSGLTGSAQSVHNIGGYFGKVVSDSAALDLRINIKTFENNSSQRQIITINNVQQDANLNVGGYIGYAESFNRLGMCEDTPISTNMFIVIGGEGKTGTINSGIIIGKNKASLGQVDMQESILNGHLKISTDNSFVINQLNAGGFVGLTSSSNFNIIKLTSLNFEINNQTSENENFLQAQDLKREEFNKTNAETNKKTYGGNRINVVNANVGGLVGLNSNTFVLSGSTVSINGGLNSDSAQFRISASGEVNAGGIVGLSNETGKTEILSNVTTSTIFDIVNTSVAENSNNIGGAIGKSTNVTISVGSDGNVIRNNSAIFINAKNINYGGAIGNSVNCTNISVKNNIIGDVLKVYGTNSNQGIVNASGLIGLLGGSYASINGNILYGDVFIEYDDSTIATTSFQALSAYNYGGLVGNIIYSSYISSASSNYVLQSTHNSRYQETNNTVHALFGNGFNGKFGDTDVNVSQTKNYYSHGVTLCKDSYGIDIGYVDNYTVEGFGVSETNSNIMSKISNQISSITFSSGHKLNPVQGIEVGDDLDDKNATSFNGIKYFTFNATYNGSNDKIKNNESYDLENIAIIGNGADLSSNNPFSYSIIDSLSGFSYVSNILIDVDIETDSKSGGLINTMTDNSLLYSVQVRGSIDAIGKNAIYVSGLVGTLKSGRIYDSSVDLDLTYRAGNLGGIFAITNTTDDIIKENNETKKSSSTDKYIDNVYALGSITTMIDTNIYTFTNGTSHTSITSSYTATKIDWNDYTTSDKMTSQDSKGILVAFGNTANVVNSYYDLSAMNVSSLYVYSENIQDKDYSDKATDNIDLFNNSTTLNNEAYGETSYYFNYGYPVLNYGFMKRSSIVKTSDENEYETKSNLVSVNNTGIVKENDDRANYIEDVEYIRLANNTLPTTKDKGYFIIYSVSALKNMVNIKGENLGTVDAPSYLINNFVLKYDLDLNGKNSELTTFNDGIFDGQGHTIDNLTSALFTYVTNSTIKNLRITNAKVDNSGILVETQILDSIISNITLSGNINGFYTLEQEKSDKSGNYNFAYRIGAIAPTIYRSNLYAVTNMAVITTSGDYETISGDDTTHDIAIGGIAGYSNSNIYKFIYNYGNINVTSVAQNNTSFKINVGGITGYTAGDNISYSYNSAGILNNYAFTNSSSLSKNTGTFVAGGIVGYATKNNDNISTKLNYTYNAGMVKAGNKTNGGEITDKDGNIIANGTAYAGGIVGLGANVTNYLTSVNNSYNYGSVEALGKNPEYKFVWMDTNSDNNVDELQMQQKSARNVYAYAIGYGITTTSTLGTYNLYSDNTNDTTNSVKYVPELVFANGASSKQNSVFYQKPLSELQEMVTQSFTARTQAKINSVAKWPGFEADLSWKGILNAIAGLVMPIEAYGVKSMYEFILNPVIPKNNSEAEVIVLNYNSYGIPTSFAVKMGFNINVKYQSGAAYSSYNIQLMFAGYFTLINGGLATSPWGLAVAVPAAIGLVAEVLGATKNGTISTKINEATSDAFNNADLKEAFTISSYDYASINISSGALSKYFEQYLYYDYSLEKPEIISEVTKEAITDIRSQVQKDTSINEQSSIEIAGNTYNIASNETIGNLLQAGVAMGEGTFISSTLPYINDLGAYSITIKQAKATEQGTEIGNYSDVKANITSISKQDDGSVVFKYKYYTAANDKGDAIDGNYNVTITCSYNKIFSFDLSDFSYYYLNGREMGIVFNDLKNSENKLYSNELYLEEANLTYDGKEGDSYNQVVKLTDADSEETIYLAYSDGMLIYIPNAILISTNDNSSKEVNKLVITNEDGSETEITELNKDTISSYTNLFNNKSYVMSIATGDTTAESLTFGYGNNISLSVTNEPSSNEGTINIKEEIDNVLNQSSSNATIYNSADLTLEIESYGIQGDTLSIGDNVIAIYNDNNWEISQNSLEYIYNDISYNLIINSNVNIVNVSINIEKSMDIDNLTNGLSKSIKNEIAGSREDLNIETTSSVVKTQLEGSTLEMSYSLSDLEKNTLGVYNATPVLAFDINNNEWSLNQEFELGKNIKIELSGSELLFNYTKSNSSDNIETIKELIENFVNNLKFYQNNFNNSLVVQENTIKGQLSKDDFVLNYNKELYSISNLSSGLKVNNLSENFNISINLVNGNPTNTSKFTKAYELNGITIYDYINFTYTKNYAIYEESWSYSSNNSKITYPVFGYIKVFDDGAVKNNYDINQINKTDINYFGGTRYTGSVIIWEIEMYSASKIENADVGEYSVVLQVAEDLGVDANTLYVDFATTKDTSSNEIESISIKGIYSNYKVGDRTYTLKFVPTYEVDENGDLRFGVEISLLDKNIEDKNSILQENQFNSIGSYSLQANTMTYLVPVEKVGSSNEYQTIADGDKFKADLVEEDDEQGKRVVVKYLVAGSEEGTLEEKTAENVDGTFVVDGNEGCKLYSIDGSYYYFTEITDYLYIYNQYDNSGDKQDTSLEENWTKFDLSTTISKPEQSSSENVNFTIKRELINEIEYIISNLGQPEVTTTSTTVNDETITQTTGGFDIKGDDISIGIYQYGSTPYIIINNKYTILENFVVEYNINNGKEYEYTKYTYTTSKQINEYKDENISYPKYSELSGNSGIDIDDINKFEVSQNDNIISYLDENGSIKVLMPKVGKTGEITLSIKVKENNKKTNTIITAKAEEENKLNQIITTLENNNSVAGTMISSKPQTAVPIILMNDIIMQNQDTAMTHANKVSIIGNDYYIAYTGRTLFADCQINDNSTFIKDLILLGNNSVNDQQKGMLYSTTSSLSSVIIKNIDMYGSLIAFGFMKNEEDDSISEVDISNSEEETPALIAASGTFNEINTYVNIDARYSIKLDDNSNQALYDKSNLTLFENKVGYEVEDDKGITYKSTVNNYGLIIVPNGIDGKNGSHGTKDSPNGENGLKGEDGVSIRAFANNDNENYNINNEGILRAGDGGNGGSGGSSYCVLGTDGVSNGKLNNYTYKAYSVGKTYVLDEEDNIMKDENDNPIKNAGSKGSFIGFSGGTKIAYNGIAGTDGILGRQPFYNFETNTTIKTNGETNEDVDYSVRVYGDEYENGIKYNYNEDDPDSEDLNIKGESTLTDAQKALLEVLFRTNSKDYEPKPSDSNCDNNKFD